MAQNEKVVLSKNLLEMKFMQRTKERYEKQTKDEDGKSLFHTDLTDKMRRSEGKFIIEPSFIACANLHFGRMSYRRFNPEIEKLMEEFNVVKKEKEEKSKEGISDEDFAKRYSSVVGTIAKKFSKKRQHSNTSDGNNDKAVRRPNEKTERKDKHDSPMPPKRKKAADFWKPTDN